MELCLSMSGKVVIVWEDSRVPIPPGIEFTVSKSRRTSRKVLTSRAGRDTYNWLIFLSCEGVDYELIQLDNVS